MLIVGEKINVEFYFIFNLCLQYQLTGPWEIQHFKLPGSRYACSIYAKNLLLLKYNINQTKTATVQIDFFSNCDQFRNFRRIWSHLLKKYFVENFIFCAFCVLKTLQRNLLKLGQYDCLLSLSAELV